MNEPLPSGQEHVKLALEVADVPAHIQGELVQQAALGLEGAGERVQQAPGGGQGADGDGLPHSGAGVHCVQGADDLLQVGDVSGQQDPDDNSK